MPVKMNSRGQAELTLWIMRSKKDIEEGKMGRDFDALLVRARKLLPNYTITVTGLDEALMACGVNMREIKKPEGPLSLAVKRIATLESVVARLQGEVAALRNAIGALPPGDPNDRQMPLKVTCHRADPNGK